MSIDVRLETGHGYLFVDSGVIRRDARNNARNESDSSRTGYLAVINDAAENDYVASRNDRIRWLGGWERENRRYDPQSLWFWEYNGLEGKRDGPLFRRNNTDILYTNWKRGEPNNWGPCEGICFDDAEGRRAEQALVMDGRGRWLDYRHTERRGYVVEFGRPGAEVNIDALGDDQTDAYTATFSFKLDQAVPESIRLENGIAGINPGLSSPT